MNKIVDELKQTGVFYVATTEGTQPRVRPFSSITEIDNELYICTNNQKNVYKQIMENSKVEICGMQKDGSWVRVSGNLVREDSDKSREAMLVDPTGPKNLYTVDDGIFEVFRLENPICTKYSMTSEPVVIK